MAAQTVTLGWNPNPEPNIAGYRLYYGTSSGNYNYYVDAGNSTVVTLSSLGEATHYYFAVTAYNSSGIESPFSSEVSYVTHDTFAAWKVRKGVSDDQADDDHDGLNAVMEYALGLAADVPDATPSSSVQVYDALTMIYTRNKSATDVTIVPEVANSPTGPWNTNEVIEVVIAEDELTETILAYDLVPFRGASRRFMRLSVQQQGASES